MNFVCIIPVFILNLNNHAPLENHLSRVFPLLLYSIYSPHSTKTSPNAVSDNLTFFPMRSLLITISLALLILGAVLTADDGALTKGLKLEGRING